MVVITYLERRQAPTSNGPEPLPGSTVMQAQSPTVSFYRYLYGQVGQDYQWTDRAGLSDQQLRAQLEAPGVGVFVLYVDGVPAGYVELAEQGHETQIVYFGLMPEFHGRGLGRYLLDWAVHRAFQRPIQRLWVHTCTLDHPRAIEVYQKAGFRAYRQETKSGSVHG
ncbi:MAG: GNAT family N-acetyltransferase [Candidatus Eremiobacteraeota bacterium]|nr:GNAT family N-acetyltransferase [Candidatus Eremiobacteraeota bacterium]